MNGNRGSCFLILLGASAALLSCAVDENLRLGVYRAGTSSFRVEDSGDLIRAQYSSGSWIDANATTFKNTRCADIARYPACVHRNPQDGVASPTDDGGSVYGIRKADGAEWMFIYRTRRQESGDCPYVRWTPRRGVIEMGISGSCQEAVEPLLVVWRLESGVGFLAQR